MRYRSQDLSATDATCLCLLLDRRRQAQKENKFSGTREQKHKRVIYKNLCHIKQKGKIVICLG